MTKKYISPFVKRNNELKKKLKPRLIWCSDGKNTYVKAKHGELL